MKLGIDQLLQDKSLRRALQGKRLALLGHPASVTCTMTHSLDALAACADLELACAFGPQHGMRGDKQDNMIETDDYKDPRLDIPVFSLYGKTRQPSAAMLQHCDVVLCDIQDVGCRIYTYITTLLYMLQACAEHGQSIWILDRPNPAGRQIDGLILEAGWQSFVGAACITMRHGLTVAEMARWFVHTLNIDVDLRIVAMADYDPTAVGYGWPPSLAWVNPSPNASSINMARVFSGSVLFEGTELSEGRGTTVPLEVVGAPDIDVRALLQDMERVAPSWLHGAKLRPCFFEPTFHKHRGKMCQGFQVHTDYSGYAPSAFKPFRLMALFMKALRNRYPDYSIWRQHAYEYEFNRLPIDVINGGPFLRLWVDNTDAGPVDLQRKLQQDESIWHAQMADVLLYPAGAA